MGVPEFGAGTNGKPRGLYGYAAQVMAIGDSTFFTDMRLAECLRSAIYHQGFGVSIQKRLENGVVGWRVWKKDRR